MEDFPTNSGQNKAISLNTLHSTCEVDSLRDARAMPSQNIRHLGAIQVLRNAVGGGGCELSRKKALVRYFFKFICVPLHSYDMNLVCPQKAPSPLH